MADGDIEDSSDTSRDEMMHVTLSITYGHYCVIGLTEQNWLLNLGCGQDQGDPKDAREWATEWCSRYSNWNGWRHVIYHNASTLNRDLSCRCT